MIGSLPFGVVLSSSVLYEPSQVFFLFLLFLSSLSLSLSFSYC